MRLPPADWVLDSEHNRRIVDGLRALGIVLVIAFHVAAFLVRELPREATVRFIDSVPSALNIVWQALGSEIVFLTSGFLLSYLLIREYRRTGRIDFKDYLIRRVSRILPLFLIALVIYLPSRSFVVERVLANLFLVSKITGHRSYIPVGWSLEVLVHVYIVLPLLVLAALRSRRPLLFTSFLIGLSLALRYAALVADPAAYATPYWELSFGAEPPKLQKDLYYLTWFRLSPFLIGMGAAIVATDHAPALTRWFSSRAASVATLLAGLVMTMVSGWLPIHRADGFIYDWLNDRGWLWFWTAQRAVLGIGIAVVLISCFFARDRVASALSGLLGLRIFGPISNGIYSIYLFHVAMLIPAGVIVLGTYRREEVLEANLWDYLAIVFLATVFSVKLAGYLSRKVERPVQEWIRNRYRGAPPAVVDQRPETPAPATPLAGRLYLSDRSPANRRVSRAARRKGELSTQPRSG